MKINYSNLSAREHFNLNGCVPRDMLEALLDKEEELNRLLGLEAHISEAKGCFPAEDFLEPIKARLIEFQKRVRGSNRDEIGVIIESLDDLAQLTFNETDYGRDELRKALKAIEQPNTSDN